MIKKVLLLLLVSALILQVQAQNWVQTGQDIDGEAASDQSGHSRSVSISSDGSVVAIGAKHNDGNGQDAGHVRVYKNINGTWTQIGADIDGEAAGDQSGCSVSINSDGSVVAIGAQNNNGNGFASGHVRVYENQGSTWTQIGTDIDGEVGSDYSGYSVSLSSNGSVVAIGTPFNDGNGQQAGHARVYQNQNGTWTQIGVDIDGEAAGDGFGSSVSLSSDGSILAVGANLNGGNGTRAGHVRVYKNESGIWTQIGQDINGEAANDQSGLSVSLSSDGSVVAIGAPYNDGNGQDAGHVRVYKNINDTWTQTGQDIDGEAGSDQSGLSISLSSDGSVVAIGATSNYGNGSSAGHVRVYKNINDTWTQIGADIDGEAAFDLSGYSVSLNSDGSVVGIGAPGNDPKDFNYGHVRVYKQPMNPPGNALDFDGTDDYVMVADHASLNPEYITVECWAKSDQEVWNNHGVMVAKRDAYLLHPVGGEKKMQFFIYINGGWEYVEYTPSIDITQWHHYAGTYDGTTLSLYIDGSLVASTLISGTIGGDAAGNLYIGSDYISDMRSLNGSMDEVRIWNVARTHCEIQGYMNTELNGDESGLVSYYNFNLAIAEGDNTGATTLTDNTTTGNHGTLYNFTLTGSNSNWIASGASISGFGEFANTFAPVPDVETLSNVTAECEVTALTAPTATDACAGTINGTHDVTLPITTRGTTVVTWTYNDGSGNTSTQTQNVVIEDVTKPTITCIGNKEIIIPAGQTKYTVSGTEFDPVTSGDNCSIASILNDFNDSETLNNAELPINTTTIVWTATDNNGNTERCSVEIQISAATSTEDIYNNGISVYPNPVSDKLVIDFDNNNPEKIVIIDMGGKVLYEKNTPEKMETIPFTQYPKGIYFVQVYTDEQVLVFKQIKQ